MKYGLNLGCGTRIFKSSQELIWHNMDAIAGPGIDVVDDCRNLKNHWQSDIDIIIAFHYFEHQGCGEQPIKECYDVLKDGGSLIVCVPDVRKLAGMWIRGELSTQIYLTNIYGPYNGTEESRHKWGFDETYLALALVVPGAYWRDIKPFDYRTIPGADIPRDDRWMLCLEAIKGVR